MKSTTKNKTVRPKSTSTLYEATPEVEAATDAQTTNAIEPETASAPKLSPPDSAPETALTSVQDFEKWANVPTMEQLAENLRHDIEFWMENGCNVEEAFDRVHKGEFGSARDIAMSRPVSSLGWSEMRQMEKVEPGSSEKMREMLLRQARAELKDGRRGARAVAHGTLTPMDEARYLALVEEIGEGWEPRNGIERTLIQQIAQSHIQYLTWQQRLNKLADGMAWEETKRPSASSKEPWLARITQAEAVNQASMMVERYQRMFLRTQRALRDLRRHSITIDRVDQLNVGDQQVNIKATDKQN